MDTRLKIVALSDACMGYGSPQVPAFLRSLVKYYNAEGIILEPDDWEKPSKSEYFSDFTIKRLLSDFHPYTQAGRIDFNRKAAKEIDKLKPDILIIVCTFCLPALLKSHHKAKFTIYYSIESITNYGKLDVSMNRYASPRIDLIIFPEENRARLDGERCNLLEIPTAILYNSSEPLFANSPIEERNGRIIHSGTIASEHTFADYYLKPEMQRMPIDLFGAISGTNKDRLEQNFASLSGSIRYRGHIDIQTLAKLRREYNYSLAIWSPDKERGYYAPSNKFFESILDGVPPITAPHPQHKMIVDRYKCGIVMEDWSFDAFYEAICHALRICDTPYYEEMVANCKKAVEQELNWEIQFKKIKRFLKEVK